MRIMMKVEMSVEAGNAAAKSGELGKKIKSLLDEQKPEAAYFIASGGKRTGILILDMADPSEIPAIAEPWFLAFDAAIEFSPAMTFEDLAKAAPEIERAVEKYG